MLVDVQPYVWISLAAIVIVATIAGLARAAADGGDAGRVTTRTVNTACQLVESAVRSASKAQQDTQAIQQLTDAQFGLAYVNCGRLLIGSDSVLDDVTSTRVGELHIALKALQRDALKKIGSQCPDLASDRPYITADV
jgi:hypothetical protein